MRLELSAFILIIISALAVAAQAPAPDVEGNWFTTLEVGGAKFRLALKIKKSADGYAAKLDSLDQGATDLTIDSIELNGDKLSFSAKQLGVNYVGTLNAAGDEITGTFKQQTIEMPLVFKRIAAVPKLNRPQEPKQPYPYTQEEVSYRNQKDNIKIVHSNCAARQWPIPGGAFDQWQRLTGSQRDDRGPSAFPRSGRSSDQKRHRRTES